MADHAFNGNVVYKQLHASLTSVTEGTEDYPRLMRVLTNERVYELVSQDEILQAQLEIQREVEPQIKELIQLAEEGLYELQQRERNLNDTVRLSIHSLVALCYILS